MGTEDRFKKKKKKDSLKRKVNTRGGLRERILIVCEGEKTEPLYFREFGITSAEIVGTGKNTMSLVQEAINIVSKAKEPYGQVWCVFDKDSFSSAQFNGAIRWAYTNNIRVAYSNEAFELWFLLHFIYVDSQLSREQYFEKLSELIGRQYDKASRDMYDLLLDKQDQAIRNAERLLCNYHELQTPPSQHNPSTTVFELVKVLRAIK